VVVGWDGAICEGGGGAEGSRTRCFQPRACHLTQHHPSRSAHPYQRHAAALPPVSTAFLLSSRCSRPLRPPAPQPRLPDRRRRRRPGHAAQRRALGARPGAPRPAGRFLGGGAVPGQRRCAGLAALRAAVASGIQTPSITCYLCDAYAMPLPAAPSCYHHCTSTPQPHPLSNLPPPTTTLRTHTLSCSPQSPATTRSTTTSAARCTPPTRSWAPAR
jgi:hypothetical protein